MLGVSEARDLLLVGRLKFLESGALGRGDGGLLLGAERGVIGRCGRRGRNGVRRELREVVVGRGMRTELGDEV